MIEFEPDPEVVVVPPPDEPGVADHLLRLSSCPPCLALVCSGSAELGSAFGVEQHAVLALVDQVREASGIPPQRPRVRPRCLVGRAHGLAVVDWCMASSQSDDRVPHSYRETVLPAIAAQYDGARAVPSCFACLATRVV